MTLDDTKELAKRHVDLLAETSRQKFISPGAGQIATYQEKAEQAIEFVAAGYPEEQIENFPFINAEATALNQTGQQTADGVLAARAAWIAAGAAIEGVRLAGKAAITNAQTVTEVLIIIDNVTTQLTSLG